MDVKHILLGIVLIVAAAGYGGYANPKWKCYEDYEVYAGWFYRMIVGLVGWIAIFAFMFAQMGVFFIATGVVLGLLLIPYRKFLKNNLDPSYPTFLILAASLGGYSRCLMACALIGIPVNKIQKNAAEMGWDKWGESMMEQARREIAYEEAQRKKEESAHWMVKLAKEMEKNDAEQWERDKERMRRQAREEYGSDDNMVFNRSHRSWKYELEKNDQWKRMK